MHEFSLVKKEVEKALGKVAGKKVSRVKFLLGRMAHGNPQSIREAFKIAAAGTALSGAELEVVVVEPKVKCGGCGKVFNVDKEINLSCPHCNSKSNELVSGEECYIENIEIED
ncbi:MAG: hydrogenase maturation nickel metallochaperone HypA [Candidatus Omnitrophica bacterium]|nr:hydrogenase maturation nickel metallochaperone HypA [Candidatus Omnitrophota bacterium]MDD5356384.1 hydrogenase maturation nickel metallochaperone HypA [Candidatus Omnitrophota bacterium]